MLDTTSQADSTLIEMVCPLTGEKAMFLNEQEQAKVAAMKEQVRQRYERLSASTPCWQRRVARNPDYFKTWDPGGIR